MVNASAVLFSLLFTLRKKPRSSDDIFIDHEPIEIVEHFKFLGHAGESKRPIAERTPNSWVTERPIANILIEMAQEAGRCPCLELNN